MANGMTKARRNGLILVALSGVFSLLWGIVLSRTVPGGVLDLQGVYHGTQCLLHHCDPYNVRDLEAYYRNQGLDDPAESAQRHLVKVLYVNLPTTFLFITPLTWLPWGAAAILWTALIAGSYFLAAYLVWDIGADYSPGIATLLVCVLLANSEVVFATGNTAGLVVSLTVIATWSFLRRRFVPIGILCFAAALAIKPHDAGLVWLYFVLAGGESRKSALKSFAITAALAAIAVIWVSYAAPNWLPEMRANLASISGSGGLNEPGPKSMSAGTAAMVIDLQAAVSVFLRRPAVYNSVSYLICGSMLILWAFKSVRSRSAWPEPWFAIAAIVPITILVTYHRPYDAKLLLLSVPACCVLWSQHNAAGKLAAFLTFVAAVLTGDIPLAMLIVIYKNVASLVSGMPGLLLTALLTQPASLALLAVAVFYLWTYMRARPPALHSRPLDETRIYASNATSV
jgi:hypothetical protein